MTVPRSKTVAWVPSALRKRYSPIHVLAPPSMTVRTEVSILGRSSGWMRSSHCAPVLISAAV